MFNFRKYTNVTDIVIPEGISLTNANFSGAFYNMRNLQNVYLTSKAELVDTTFQYCYNLIEPTVCGPNVNKMENTYANCANLRNAVCGDNVTSMWATYNSCTNLTTAVCGPNVNQMRYTYSYCRNLTTAVCGPNVTIMEDTYVSCNNLTKPVCGPNVTSLSGTYSYCSNLEYAICSDTVTHMLGGTYAGCKKITTPVCGPNVTDMQSTYAYCTNLTTAVCGPNVRSMASSFMGGVYQGCTNIKTAVCGPKVTEMHGTYHNCHNLTTAACGDNVTSMLSTYMNCCNLTEPVCGPNVTIMSNIYSYEGVYQGCVNLQYAVCGNKVVTMHRTYAGCTNIKTAVCGPSVVNIDYAYVSCSNLTTAACGDKVQKMNGTYMNCVNLTDAVCGPNVTDMGASYERCINLINGVIGPKVTNTTNVYAGCTNLTNIVMSDILTSIGDNAFCNCVSLSHVNIPANVTSIGNNAFCNCIGMKVYDFSRHTTVPTITSSTFGQKPSDCIFIVPTNLYVNWTKSVHWQNLSDTTIPDTKTVIETKIRSTNYILTNSSIVCSLKICKFDNEPIVSIVSDNTNYVTISDILVTQESDSIHALNFKINALSTISSTNVRIQISDGDYTYDQTFGVNVCAEYPYSYTVEDVPDSLYGFILNDDGYYESNNKGKSNTAAVCKVTINNDANLNVYLDCINSGEINYDFGILSTVGNTLTLNNAVDTGDNVKISLKEAVNDTVTTVDYGVISGVIYVKYRKDGSGNSGKDSLQFKVRFE